jgi:error-prone DNA polymerase
VATPGARLPGVGTQLALGLELPGAPALRVLEPWEAMVADYATTGLTLGAHPMALLRPHLEGRPNLASARDLEVLPHETQVSIGGLVVARQRPGTAKGIVFMLMEDEFGTINLIVPPDLYERRRLTIRSEPLVIAEGRLEKLPIAAGAINVLVREIRPLEAPSAARAEVVDLAERARAARADQERPDTADFRGVAPAVQSFAQGRRR